MSRNLLTSNHIRHHPKGPNMKRSLTVGLAALAAVMLAGCSSSSGSTPRTALRPFPLRRRWRRLRLPRLPSHMASRPRSATCPGRRSAQAGCLRCGAPYTPHHARRATRPNESGTRDGHHDAVSCRPEGQSLRDHHLRHGRQFGPRLDRLVGRRKPRAARREVLNPRRSSRSICTPARRRRSRSTAIPATHIPTANRCWWRPTTTPTPMSRER